MTSLRSQLSPILHTPRLTLHLLNYTPDHYSCLLNAMNSATAHARMGDLGIRTPAKFDELNTSTRLTPAAFGRTSESLIVDTDIYYMLSPKSDPASLMGGISLAQRGPDLPPDAGWCLLEAWHGHGYAAEAARALLTHIATLGVSSIMAWPGKDTVPSCRTAEKAGFVYGGELPNHQGALQTVYLLPGMDFEGLRGK